MTCLAHDHGAEVLHQLRNDWNDLTENNGAVLVATAPQTRPQHVECGELQTINIPEVAVSIYQERENLAPSCLLWGNHGP